MKKWVFLVMLAACDPPFTMEGSVVDADGKPVAGAHVALVCDGVDERSADSNGSGEFADRELGWFPLTCTLEVMAPGRAPASFSLKDHCTRMRRSSACSGITLHAQLPR